MGILDWTKRSQFQKAYGLEPGEYKKLDVAKQRMVKEDFRKYCKNPSPPMKEAPRFVDKELKELTLLERAKLFEDHEYKVLVQTHVNGYHVSTVWLGLNHGTAESPTYFETMIFKGESLCEEYQARYHNESEARAHHKELVKLIKLDFTPNKIADEGY